MKGFARKMTSRIFKLGRISYPLQIIISPKIWQEIIFSPIYSNKDWFFTSSHSSSCSSKFYRSRHTGRGSVTSYNKKPDFNHISNPGKKQSNPNSNSKGSFRTWSRAKIWSRKWNYNFRDRLQVVSQDRYLGQNPQCKLLARQRLSTDKLTVAWKYSKVHICSLDHYIVIRRRQLRAAQWLNNVVISIWKMISFAKAQYKMTTWSSINKEWCLKISNNKESQWLHATYDSQFSKRQIKMIFPI